MQSKERQLRLHCDSLIFLRKVHKDELNHALSLPWISGEPGTVVGTFCKRQEPAPHSQRAFQGFIYPRKCSADLAIKTRDTNPVLKPLHLGRCWATATPGEDPGPSLRRSRLCWKAQGLSCQGPAQPQPKELWKAGDQQHPPCKGPESQNQHYLQCKGQ